MTKKWIPKFVWVRARIGDPIAQIWQEDMCKTVESKTVEPLFSKDLNDEDLNLHLNELIEKYPCPTFTRSWEEATK